LEASKKPLTKYDQIILLLTELQSTVQLDHEAALLLTQKVDHHLDDFTALKICVGENKKSIRGDGEKPGFITRLTMIEQLVGSWQKWIYGLVMALVGLALKVFFGA